MCGRYVIAYDPQTLVTGFSLTRIQPFDRRWNVAPQSAVPVVYETREGERVAELMRWGLLPHWAKDPALGAKLNNARSEGLADKPSFRQAVRRRRCILPASGFFEWQPVTGADGKPAKQPHYISPVGAPFFAMAGLFEAWRPPLPAGTAEATGGAGVAGATDAREWVLTCCVITTAANTLMAPLHDRMPVMLPPEHWAAWLDRGHTDPASLAPLMHGLPAGAMQAWPVARTVGRSSAEGPGLIEPWVEVPAGTPADRSNA
jgi:putative SOS response-associated peptidase YedK